jgi:hypothetical protein
MYFLSGSAHSTWKYLFDYEVYLKSTPSSIFFQIFQFRDDKFLVKKKRTVRAWMKN